MRRVGRRRRRWRGRQCRSWVLQGEEPLWCFTLLRLGTLAASHLDPTLPLALRALDPDLAAHLSPPSLSLVLNRHGRTWLRALLLPLFPPSLLELVWDRLLALAPSAPTEPYPFPAILLAHILRLHRDLASSTPDQLDQTLSHVPPPRPPLTPQVHVEGRQVHALLTRALDSRGALS